jgi:hypothetical protein
MEYTVEADSLGVIADNVAAIQAEILVNGPVFAAFWVYPDFMHYQVNPCTSKASIKVYLLY